MNLLTIYHIGNIYQAVFNFSQVISVQIGISFKTNQNSLDTATAIQLVLENSTSWSVPKVKVLCILNDNFLLR